MNKYLLLRDNKQSGPYTVPEIIAKGIKPYDLVWLEGKSAAWRYPSEIEELKAHAPAVEEQPFDRFYKKPEPQAAPASTATETARFQPVPAKEDTFKKAAPQKIYINFPGGQQSSVVSTTPPSSLGEEKLTAAQSDAHTTASAMSAASTVSASQPAVQTPTAAQPAAQMPAPAPLYKVNPDPNPSAFTTRFAGTDDHFIGAVRAGSNKNLLYAAIGAGIILIAAITALLFSYSSQRNSIRQLSNIVQQMEKEQREQPKSGASLVSTVSEPTKEPVTTVAAETAESQPEKIMVKEKPATRPVNLPAAALNQTKSVIRDEQTEPVGQTNAAAPVQKEVATENLFKLVSVKPNDYKTGVLGGISNLQMELTNNSAHALHRVAVVIRYLSPEKKVIRTQTVYFDNVAPGMQSSIDVPKSKRGVSIDYTITDIKS